jgi:hypothetical protein
MACAGMEALFFVGFSRLYFRLETAWMLEVRQLCLFLETIVLLSELHYTKRLLRDIGPHD